MFLKMNRRLWDKADLVKANRNRKKAVGARYQNLKEEQQGKLREIVAWEEAQARASAQQS